MVPTKRSAMAFARGARTGVLMIWMSMAANTASKAAVNLLSRSRIKNRKRRWAVVEVHEQGLGDPAASDEVSVPAQDRGRGDLESAAATSG